MKAGTIYCYCISKDMTSKRSIAKSQYTYIYRARLTMCEMGVFLRVISNSKIHPLPSLGKFIAHAWVYFRENMVLPVYML